MNHPATAAASNNIQIGTPGRKMEAPATPATADPAAATATTAATAAAPATVPPAPSPPATTAATGALPPYPPPSPEITSPESRIESLEAKIAKLEQEEEQAKSALDGGPLYLGSYIRSQVDFLRSKQVAYPNEKAELKREQKKQQQKPSGGLRITLPAETVRAANRGTENPSQQGMRTHSGEFTFV